MMAQLTAEAIALRQPVYETVLMCVTYRTGASARMEQRTLRQLRGTPTNATLHVLVVCRFHHCALRPLVHGRQAPSAVVAQLQSFSSSAGGGRKIPSSRAGGARHVRFRLFTTSRKQRHNEDNPSQISPPRHDSRRLERNERWRSQPHYFSRCSQRVLAPDTDRVALVTCRVKWKDRDNSRKGHNERQPRSNPANKAFLSCQFQVIYTRMDLLPSFADLQQN
jgi:hypothetical protein